MNLPAGLSDAFFPNQDRSIIFNVMPEKNEIGQSRAGTIIPPDGTVIVDSPGVFRYSRRSAPFGFNGGWHSTLISRAVADQPARLISVIQGYRSVIPAHAGIQRRCTSENLWTPAPDQSLPRS